MPIMMRLTLIFLYMLNTFFSYMLMLIVMTFNAGLFCATIVGLTIGYAIFGYLKKKSEAAKKVGETK